MAEEEQVESVEETAQAWQAETQAAAIPSLAEFYRDFFERAPDMFCLLDAATAEIQHCNQTMAQTMGYRKEELIGRRLFDLYHPDCLDRAKTAFHQAVTNGGTGETDLQLILKDRRVIDVSLKTSPVRDDRGHIVRTRAIMRDVADRVKADLVLRRNEQLFRLALGKSPVVVFSQDKDLVYHWMFNPLPEFDVDDIVGKTDFDLLRPDDAERLTAIKRHVLQSGVGVREDIAAAVGGHLVVHDFTIEPIRDGDGNVIGIAGASFEVTARRRTEEALLRATAELEGRASERAEHQDVYGLSARELSVLMLIASGRSDSQIGKELGITTTTASKHVANILKKMDVDSRTEASVRALRDGLIG